MATNSNRIRDAISAGKTVQVAGLARRVAIEAKQGALEELLSDCALGTIEWSIDQMRGEDACALGCVAKGGFIDIRLRWLAGDQATDYQ